MQSRTRQAILFLATCAIMIPLLIVAGTFGKITGIVIDTDTGQPIPGATVMLAGTTQGTFTDQNGRFVIDQVKPGVYTLIISSLGYNTVEIKSLEVIADISTLQDVEMAKKVTERDKVIKCVPMADEFMYEAKKQVSCNAFMPTLAGRSNIAYEQSGGFPPAHGGTAIVNGDAFDAMFFKDYGVNPFVDTEDDHLSTFAIDVDDASYIMTRSYLERGELPPDEAVRVEEFVNHFKYNYDAPQSEAFRVYLEGAPSKFGQNSQLLRIGIKGKKIDDKDRRPANLVFVIDVSGSMAREDRLGLVKKALRLLVDELRESDEVGIVVYGSRGNVILEPTSIRDKEKILSAIEFLHSEGSTNAEEGLKLGYQMTDRNFDSGKINRIILCSDGVANVGVTKAEELLKWIKGYADRGITLSTIGFGMGNYNDILMEKIGDKGNGHYAYVDDIAEARRIFVENLTGTLQVIARDVKIQVDFNPDVVRSYRLLGYENRDVDDDKFRDDKEDGGEIGSGHEVTALYEIKFHNHELGKNIGTVYIRYKDPDNFEVDEINIPIEKNNFKSSFDKCTSQFKLAAVSAEFAEILRKSYWAKGSKFEDVEDILRMAFGGTENREVIELQHLVSKAVQLQDQLAEK